MEHRDERYAGRATLLVVQGHNGSAAPSIPLGGECRAEVLEVDEREALVKASIPLPLGTQVRLIDLGESKLELVGTVAAVASIPERFWLELEALSESARAAMASWLPNAEEKFGAT